VLFSQSPRLRSGLQQGLDGPDGYAGSDMARREVQHPPPGEHRRIALFGVALEAGAADVPAPAVDPAVHLDDWIKRFWDGLDPRCFFPKGALEHWEPDGYNDYWNYKPGFL